MHGVLFAELQQFATAGGDPWHEVLADAALANHIYLPIREYPDGEAVAIVQALARRRRLSPPEVLEAFGTFIVPGLLEMYGSLLKPEWGALDLIEHTESTVHRIVRIRQAGARPPYLSCERVGPRELHVTYTSERRMCRLARGMIAGIARHKGETLKVEEPSCMLEGASRCLLVITSQDGPRS